MPQAIRVIDRAADLADVATPFTDGGFLRWNNSTGKFETARVSHAELADLNGDHHNIYLRTDGMRAMTARLDVNIAGGEPAIRVTQAGVTTIDIDSNGIFRAYPESAYHRVFEVFPSGFPEWYPTFSVDGLGRLSWGDGYAADVTLYHDTASRLRVSGSLSVGGHLYVDNNLHVGNELHVDNDLYVVNDLRVDNTLTTERITMFPSDDIAIRINEAERTTVDIRSSGVFWTYPAEASHDVFIVQPRASGYSTFAVKGTGQISWGDGSSAADVTLYRDQASQLRVGGNLRVDGGLHVSGGLITGRIYSTATSAATSSLTPAFLSGGHVGVGVVIAPNLETLVLYGYRYGDHPILMVSAKGYTADSLAPWDASASAWLTVLADGNVGIGTVLPKAKLDVINGCIRAQNGSNTVPSSGAGVEIMMTGGVGYIRSRDRGTATEMPLHFFASEYEFKNAAIRCDSGFNVGGNAGFSGTIPAGRDIYVSGGIITGHS